MSNGTTRLTVLAIGASLSACGGAGAGTFEAKGTIEISTSPDSKCYTVRDDGLHEGGALRIRAKGNTVVMGKVGPPTFVDQSNGVALRSGPYVCSYAFAVSGVPAGEKFYTVIIDGQGEKEVSEDELASGKTILAVDKLDNKPS